MARKEKIRMSRMIFFRIKIYVEMYDYELPAMHFLKWEDCSGIENFHKISKIPN